jgi:DNA-directed RNA polymerase specialized sigma24 family protein
MSSSSNPQTLAELLASLPEEERIILTLHYLRSQSSADIATFLSVPERAVIAVIESGKARLTAILGL